MTRSLVPEQAASVPAPEHAPLVEQLGALRLENATLLAEPAILKDRIRELEARLDQNSSNSSRPLAADPIRPQRVPNHRPPAASTGPARLPRD